MTVAMLPEILRRVLAFTRTTTSLRDALLKMYWHFPSSISCLLRTRQHKRYLLLESILETLNYYISDMDIEYKSDC